MSLEQELAAEKAAREAAEKKAAESQAELKKLQDEQHAALRDGAHEQNAEFAEGLVKEGRLKPADKDLIVKVLDFAEYPDDVTADSAKAVRSSLCLLRCVRFLPPCCRSRFRVARWLKVKRRRDWRQTLPKRRTRKP